MPLIPIEEEQEVAGAPEEILAPSIPALPAHLTLIEEPEEIPADPEKEYGEIYDLSEKSGLPIEQAETLYKDSAVPYDDQSLVSVVSESLIGQKVKSDEVARAFKLLSSEGEGEEEVSDADMQKVLGTLIDNVEFLKSRAPNLRDNECWEVIARANGGQSGSGNALRVAITQEAGIVQPETLYNFAAENIQQQNDLRRAKGLPPLSMETQVAITDAYRQILGIRPVSGAYDVDAEGRATPRDRYTEIKRRYNKEHHIRNYLAARAKGFADIGLGLIELKYPEWGREKRRELEEFYAVNPDIYATAGGIEASVEAMLPAILSGNPYVAGTTLSLLAGSSAGQVRGDIYEAREAGMDISALQEAGATVAIGALEYALERYGLKVAGTGATVLKKTVKVISKDLAEEGLEQASKTAAKKLIPLLKEQFKGTAEELGTQIAQNISNRLIWNPEQQVFEGAREAAVGGFFAQALFSGFGAFAQPRATQGPLRPSEPVTAKTESGELKAYAEARQKYGVSELSGLGKKEIQTEDTDKIFAEADKAKTPTGVIYIDIANFKSINDVLGHDEGDRAVTVIGQVIKDSVREARGDIAGFHPGGDEFTAVLKNTNLEQAEIVRSRLQESVNTALEKAGLGTVKKGSEEFPVFAAAGVAIRESGGMSFKKTSKIAETRSNEIKAKMKVERGGEYARPEEGKAPEAVVDMPAEPEHIRGAKERGFITSAKEVVPTQKIKGEYVPRSTDELAIKAKSLIAEDVATAEKYALEGRDDNSIAITAELLKHYGDRASEAKTQSERDLWYQKAADLANEKARVLTEAGRMVQAASILGRLTPEGQVRFAAREIQRYNEQVEETQGGLFGMKKKIPELTKDQTKYITDEMQAISSMPEGRAKSLRFHKLQQHINALAPTPLLRKLTTIWKAGLLTGVRTSGLNIFSNITHGTMETVKDVPAEIVDRAVSLVTGERAVAASLGGMKTGGKEGIYEAWEYLKTGYDPRHDVGMKLDIKRYNMGKGKLGKAMQMYTESVFRFLGAQDQPFYYAAKIRSFHEQAKVAAINEGLKGGAARKHIDMLIKSPTDKMVRNASKDAETAVFMNKTNLGEAAKKLQTLPGGEVIAPFARTPSAVAMQIVNYSPAGAVKTIIENIGQGRFNQRDFSRGIGRSVTGTGIMFIGAKLFEAGLMSLDWPEGERERELWKAEGRTPNSVKIGGKWKSAKVMGVAANLLFVGGHFQRAFTESGSPNEAITDALTGSGKQFTEQTFLEGADKFTSALTDPERSMPRYVGGLLASVVPRGMADIAEVTDVRERRAEGIAGRLQKRIPGVRQQMEPEVTVLGEGIPGKNPYDVFRSSMAVRKPVVQELLRLWDEGWEVSPAKLGRREGYESLTPQENTALWQRAGNLTNQGLDAIMTAPGYKDLTDEAKAEEIEKAIATAQEAAKTEAVVKKLNTLREQDQVQMLFRMKSEGLVTQKMIPGIKLSKRKPRPGKKAE